MQPVEEIAPVDADTFESEIRPLYRPVVMRGLAKDWPIVRAGLVNSHAALSQIEGFDTREPTDIMIAPQSEKGRFFYSEDLRGFNFRREKLSLSGLAAHLREIENSPEPIGIYAGATAARSHLPGFEESNPLPLVSNMDAITRIWLGNATQVATHFDLSDNIAVVALGKRTFTLFPPEAIDDLYIGPLNNTLAGQPVSMVDPIRPDLERFPRYSRAQEVMLTAELEPGDAMYIPTLWWHHVSASAAINVLVNYWHNDADRGGGFLALVHALLAIRDQPVPQKKAWQAWFNHLVFDEDASAAASHLPPHAQGVNGPSSPERNAMIRQYIVQVLSSR